MNQILIGKGEQPVYYICSPNAVPAMAWLQEPPVLARPFLLWC